MGLNTQAASVVIICESQIKPTRGVDERMLEMLKNETQLFDAYARRSAVAESKPDTADVSDTAMARQMAKAMIAADVDPTTWDTSKGLGPNDANVQKVYA